MRRPKLQTQYLVDRLVRDHVFIQDLAAEVGMTRYGIWKRLKAAGRYDEVRSRYRLTCVCAHCGEQFVKRKRLLMQCKGESYCSARCYYESRANPQYFQSRQGQRTARLIVQEHYALPINAPYIVHHKDSNDTHNNQDNLMVFANQSDHLKHHYGKAEVVPLWDGSHCECERCGA
jgi:hypothetical protein